LSFCAANVFTCFARIAVNILRARARILFDNASFLPLKDYSLTEIGADKAANTYQLVGKSFVLIAGDLISLKNCT
jgi:hypothetical protein